MAGKPKLNPEVLSHLHARLGKSISTIRSAISRLKRKFPESTSNAVAQVYAEQHGESVRRLIGKEDKRTIPPVKIERTAILKGKDNRKENIRQVIRLHTTDHFLQKHIVEINRAYTKHCYTCVFVLTRKVLENMIISILRTKYPTQRDLYFDKSRNRNHDFSVVLDNLFKRRNDFGHEANQAIERLNQKLKPFKNDANDKAHSLFHVVENAKEVDDWNLDTIVALITSIN